jgi:hypothetical protein
MTPIACIDGLPGQRRASESRRALTAKHDVGEAGPRALRGRQPQETLQRLLQAPVRHLRRGAQAVAGARVEPTECR